jgi:hypothetical protein
MDIISDESFSDVSLGGDQDDERTQDYIGFFRKCLLILCALLTDKLL